METTETEPLETGAELLDQAAGFIREFCVLPSSAYADMIAVWCAHTWVFKAFENTPRLGILSDKPQSGKTRVLTLASLLSCKPKTMSTYTPPVFQRVLNKKAREGGTVLMDETDTVFRTERSEPKIQGPFNDGFGFEGTSDRCAGSDEIEEKPIFCPIAFAGLKYLPPACMSRTIMVYMVPRRPEQKIGAYQSKLHASWGKGIGESLGQWAASQALQLAEAWPDLPEGCEDRTADKWWPLFAIAQVASQDQRVKEGEPTWLERIEAAYAEITQGVASDPPVSPLTRLLGDIRTVWTGERLSSSVLIERLMALPDAPWGVRWPSNKVAATKELATMLRGSGIAPRKMRIDGGAPVAGYDRSAFEPHWSVNDMEQGELPEHSR